MGLLKRRWREFMIVAVWIITVTAKIKYHGLVFGFDYGIYQPDGIHYTYRTLVFMGQSQQEAAQQVVDWYAMHASKVKTFSPQNILPEDNPVWGVVSQRILYPILSVPFVAVFGIIGMLAIPAISLLVLMLITLKLSMTYKVPNFGLAIALLLTCSPTVMRWMIVNCTDSLLAGLFGIVVLILAKEEWSRKDRILMYLLCGATSLTRICLPIWILLSLVLFYRRQRILATTIASISIIFSIPTLLAAPSNAVLPSATETSGLSKLIYLPISFLRIIAFEFAQLAVLDRLLLIGILLAIFFSILKLKNSSSQFFLGVLIATFVIGGVNGELGVNFRYQLPQIPFMVWVITQKYSTRWFENLAHKLESKD